MFLDDVAKNTIPMIHKMIEINANSHNHRLMKLFITPNNPEVAVGSAPTVANTRKTKLAKSQSIPIITGDNANHRPNFLFMFLYKK